MCPHPPFVDIHCHLLPQLDDGAATWKESLRMARSALADGISTIVATPHQFGPHGHCPDRIRARTIQLQQQLDDQGIALRMLAGAEVRIEAGLVAHWREGRLLALAGRDRHVLLELPHEVYLPLDRLVSELRTAGLVAILAHPERNLAILARPDLLGPLVKGGCLLQVTAGSLLGRFGPAVERLGQSLVRQGIVHFVASDAHDSEGRAPLLSAAFECVAELAGVDAAIDLCCKNPATRGGRRTRGRRPTRGDSLNGRVVPLEKSRMNSMRALQRPAMRGPLRAILAALVVAAASVAVAGWADTRTVGPFVCRADFSLADLQQSLADLAQLQTDLTRLLGLPPAQGSIELYLFHDKATYADYLNRYLPKVPYRRALYVKGRGPGRVFAYWSREFDEDLRHECVHALLHASLPMVPLWLDEGLAEYLEVPASQRLAGHRHLVPIRWNASLGKRANIEDLEKKGSFSELGQADYRDAWAWVHFMLHGPPAAKEELLAFLKDIHQGTPPGALSARLRRRLPQLDQQYIVHFVNRTRAVASERLPSTQTR